jgi:hypothetical protein
MDVGELTRHQQVSLWLDGREGLHTPADALRFIDEVGIALRYGSASNLPLASMYRATQRHVPVPEDEKPAHARAFELTNALLASGSVIEINLIANRLVLAHERVVPAIYGLRRVRADAELSDTARQAFEFIAANASATTGDIRHLLNAEGQPRPDAADLALTELQRALLVDRGPSSGSGKGVFYLTKEGYPYRLFAPSHPEIVATASRLSRPTAAADLLRTYLKPAVFATRRKLASLFQPLLTAAELEAALADLSTRGLIQPQRLGRTEVVVYRDR